MFDFYYSCTELVELSHNQFNPKEENDMKIDNQERQKCEVWTRVMGYHRPVSAFNKGKQSEHKERQHFQER